MPLLAWFVSPGMGGGGGGGGERGGGERGGGGWSVRVCGVCRGSENVPIMKDAFGKKTKNIPLHTVYP